VDWSDVGREAQRIDNEERPRRKQTNIDLPEDLKREFKAARSAGREADAVRGRGSDPALPRPGYLATYVSASSG
jgi:hypothetical protein